MALALAGCTESYDESAELYPTLTPRYLSVSPTTIDFTSSQASSMNLTVTSMQTPWKIDNSADWLSFSAANGNSDASVSVSTTENMFGDVARTAVAFFRAELSDWAFEQPLSITQAGAEPVINLSESSVDLSAVAGSFKKISVTSNCDWDVSTSTSWLSVEKSGNELSITVTENTESGYREGSVQVSHKGNRNITKNIKVSQAVAGITASTQSISIENAASAVNITVNAEASWTVSTTSSWIDLSPTSGSAGSSLFTANISPNTSVSERNGYIILSIGSIERIRIPVTQKGIYISSETTSLSFSAGVSSQTFDIQSNTSWQVISSPDWLTVSPSNGTGNASLSVTTKDNPNTTLRTGTIRVSQPGLSMEAVVSVTQTGKNFELRTTMLSFEDMRETQSFEIVTDGAWTASTSDDWISLGSTSGQGAGMISVTVSENTAGVERLGQVSVTVGDKTLTVKIVQKGKYVEIDENALNFPAGGSTLDLNIRSNASWAVGSKPDWINVDQTSGNGSKTVKVTAEDNPNTTARSGQLHIIQSGMDLDIVVSVTQSGKSFEIGTTVLNFNDKQETQTVNINTDGKWVAKSDYDWITVSPASYTGNYKLSITVSENTAVSERTGFVQISVGDKSFNVQVNQKGKFFTITSDNLTYPSRGGNIRITLSSNDNWKAEVEDGASWLTLSTTSGSGNATVTLVASDNPSVNKRSGSVVFTSRSHQSVRFTVTQAARYLTVDTQRLLFYSKGGTSDVVTISTDAQYSITSDVSWLAITRSGDTFTVTASENTTQESRFGKITIVMTDLNDGSYKLEIDVTQLNYGGTFIKTGYGDDHNWDGHGDGGSTNSSLVINPYGSDKNWDTSSSSNTTLSISGWTSDKNWDTAATSGVTITITGYSNDKNYDNTNSSSGSMTKGEYSSDKNWQ